MRRVLFALAAGLLLFCCGCQNNTDDKTAKPIADAFSATVAISQGAFSYTAEISKRADGTFVTTLKEPAALNGLTITQTADNCSFAFAGLNLQTPPSLLPDAAFSSCMQKAFETLLDSTRFVAAQHGTDMVYSGRTENGNNFTFTAEKDTGVPRTLEFPERQLTITFSDYKATS